MTTTGVTVLYIAGTGRSGSTLLANILGHAHGASSVGEVRYLWRRGLLEQRLCGCGAPLAECEVWRLVLERSGVAEDPASVVAMQDALQRGRRVPPMRWDRLRNVGFEDRLRAYRDVLGRLYTAIADVSGASVIVDSSKLPTYGWILGGAPGVDLRVVHLVRDPRAAAYSWLRHKVQPDRRTPGTMERQPAHKSAALWTYWNAVTTSFWARDPARYLRVSYDDFVARPEATTRAALELAGLPRSVELPFVAADQVQLGVTHTVAGNPNRLDRGPVTVRGDDEWRREMTARDRAIVDVLTLPSRRRYGFR